MSDQSDGIDRAEIQSRMKLNTLFSLIFHKRMWIGIPLPFCSSGQESDNHDSEEFVDPLQLKVKAMLVTYLMDYDELLKICNDHDVSFYWVTGCLPKLPQNQHDKIVGFRRTRKTPPATTVEVRAVMKYLSPRDRFIFRTYRFVLKEQKIFGTFYNTEEFLRLKYEHISSVGNTVTFFRTSTYGSTGERFFAFQLPDSIINGLRKLFSSNSIYVFHNRDGSPITTSYLNVVFQAACDKAQRAGQPSLGLFSDEGGRMLGGYAMSKDNLLKTSCGLSSFWDGKPVTRIRSGDENLILYGRRLSTHLMIQEVVFADIQKNDILLGQGLMARCLIVFPPTNAGNRPYREIDISMDSIIQEYFKHASDLLDTSYPLPNLDVPNELSPRPLSLDTDAKALWVEFHDEMDRSMRKEGHLRAIRRTVSKAPEQALRIAGVLTLFENIHATAISSEILARALILVQYYIDEALRISEMGFVDQDLALAQRVLDWMKKKIGKEPSKDFSLQEIYQSAGPREVRNKKTALHILRILEDHNEIYRPDSGQQRWKLNENNHG